MFFVIINQANSGDPRFVTPAQRVFAAWTNLVSTIFSPDPCCDNIVAERQSMISATLKEVPWIHQNHRPRDIERVLDFILREHFKKVNNMFSSPICGFAVKRFLKDGFFAVDTLHLHHQDLVHDDDDSNPTDSDLEFDDADRDIPDHRDLMPPRNSSSVTRNNDQDGLLSSKSGTSRFAHRARSKGANRLVTSVEQVTETAGNYCGSIKQFIWALINTNHRPSSYKASPQKFWPHDEISKYFDPALNEKATSLWLFCDSLVPYLDKMKCRDPSTMSSIDNAVEEVQQFLTHAFSQKDTNFSGSGETLTIVRYMILYYVLPRGKSGQHNT